MSRMKFFHMHIEIAKILSNVQQFGLSIDKIVETVTNNAQI